MQSIGSHPEHHVRLNAAARADIVWWHLFAEEWNGISILWDNSALLPEFNIFADASGSWGCGAWSFSSFISSGQTNFAPFQLLLRSLFQW